MSLWALAPSGEAQPIPFEAREILVAGDEVEGIGRIGYADVTVVGLSNDDRVVFTALTSTGAEGVFSADQNGIETLWLAHDPDRYLERIVRVRANVNRVVFAEGFTGDGTRGFFQITGGATPPLIEYLDILPGDLEVCSLGDFVLSDSGAVGVSLFTAPAEALCRFDSFENLYVFENGAIRDLIRTNNDSGPYIFRLLALTAEGRLLAALADDDSAILTIREDDVYAVVFAGDPGPDGAPLRPVRGAAGNSLGDVAFYSGTANATVALYRTEGGRVVKVAEVGEVLSDQYDLEYFPEESTILSKAGAVATEARLRRRADGSDSVGTVLFPPGGAPRVLARSGALGGINDRGAVAVYDAEERQVVIADGADTEPRRVVGFGDAVPGAGVLATRGLYFEARCLAEDGRVAADVESLVASPALSCGDADGFVALTGPHRPARDGSEFRDFSGCAFSDTGVLFIGAHAPKAGTLEWNLYRSDANGLERLIGPDLVTTDGARIIRLLDRVLPSFTSNKRGTVIVRALTDRGERRLLRRPDGGIESILLEQNMDDPIRAVTGIRIRDDDRLVASVRLETEEEAIVAVDGSAVRLLVAASDPRLPDGPYEDLAVVFAGEDRVVFRGRTSDGVEKTFSYSDDLELAPFFPDGIEYEVQQVSSGGRALVRANDRSQYLLTPDGSLTLVSRGDVTSSTAVDINDRGNVFWFRYYGPHGTHAHALLLAGPPPTARCPRAPSTETPEPTATATSAETSVSTQTPTAVETSTPTRTPAPTDTHSPTSTAVATQTNVATQTPMDTATPTRGSPTPVLRPVEADGCRVVSSSDSRAWILLLPPVALLVRRRAEGVVRVRRRGSARCGGTGATA